MAFDLTGLILNYDGSKIEITDLTLAVELDSFEAAVQEEDRPKYQKSGKFMVLKTDFRKFLTIKRAIAIAVAHVDQEEDKTLSLDKVCSRGHLSLRVQNSNGECELSVEEIVEIKKLVRRKYGPVSPVIVSQVYDVIDPPSATVKEEESKQEEKDVIEKQSAAAPPEGLEVGG